MLMINVGAMLIIIGVTLAHAGITKTVRPPDRGCSYIQAKDGTKFYTGTIDKYTLKDGTPSFFVMIEPNIKEADDAEYD